VFLAFSSGSAKRDLLVDSEGTGNANGVDNQLGKALAVVSSITTVRIAVSQRRLCDDLVDGVASTLKLQCLKTNRASAAELSSTVVFMYSEVGLPGAAAQSLVEAEQRRRDQDQGSLAAIRSKFPDHNFNPDNLLVLLQPQLSEFGMPIEYAADSYM
jgi:hypothetical protein